MRDSVRAAMGNRGALFLFPFALAAACGTSNGNRPKSASDLFPGVDCKKVRLPAEPDLVLWDARQRAQLDQARRQGVVAVRYEREGCDVSLELIPQCVGPKNRYVYSPIHTETSIAAHDANELFAKMPLGASSVASQLHDDKAVRADIQLVGNVGLPAGSQVTEYDLVGPDCRRATHVVGAVYVGGFALGAGKPSRVDAAKNLLAKNDVEQPLAREGDAVVCERAAKEGVELAGCAAPVRLALVPLEGRAPLPVCPGATTWNGTRCIVEGAAPVEDAGAPPPAVFDDAAVEKVVRSHQPVLRRACWDGVPGTLKRLDLQITLRVDRQGRVSNAVPRVQGAEGPSDLAQSVARCVSKDVEGWTFPDPDGEKTLTLPFHLLRQ